jgi:hypothetical protein
MHREVTVHASDKAGAGPADKQQPPACRQTRNYQLLQLQEFCSTNPGIFAIITQQFLSQCGTLYGGGREQLNTVRLVACFIAI